MAMKKQNRTLLAGVIAVTSLSVTQGCTTEPNARDNWMQVHNTSLEPTEIADPRNPGKLMPYSEYKKMMAAQQKQKGGR